MNISQYLGNFLGQKSEFWEDPATRLMYFFDKRTLYSPSQKKEIEKVCSDQNMVRYIEQKGIAKSAKVRAQAIRFGLTLPNDNNGKRHVICVENHKGYEGASIDSKHFFTNYNVCNSFNMCMNLQGAMMIGLKLMANVSSFRVIKLDHKMLLLISANKPEANCTNLPTKRRRKRFMIGFRRMMAVLAFLLALGLDTPLVPMH